MKKTKTAALICEFNPLHTGHEYILSEMKRECNVICIMSGNFVQRSIPSVFDKYTRAGLLVSKPRDGGEAAADLVVELPFPWCSSGTEFFAMG